MINVKIILKSGSEYDEVFMNLFEMDQYYEDNKDIVKDIKQIQDSEEE